MIENVPGLVSFEHGATLHAILDALAELGYGADVRILGAAYYGVPQMRWRTVILGLRGKTLPPLAFPEPIYHAPVRPNFTTTFDGQMLVKMPSSEASVKFTTVREAIGDLPPLKCGERGAVVKPYACDPSCDYQRRARIGSTGVYNHEAPRLSKENQERLKYIKPGGNWTDIPDALLPEGMKRARKSDHTKRYGRVMPDGLASTILTKCDPHWGHISTMSKIGRLPLERQLASSPSPTTSSLLVLRCNNLRKSEMLFHHYWQKLLDLH